MIPGPIILRIVLLSMPSATRGNSTINKSEENFRLESCSVVRVEFPDAGRRRRISIVTGALTR